MFKVYILSFSLLFVVQQPLQAAGGNGPLWEKRAENAVSEDEKREPSLVPAVLGGAAGGIAGIELAIVGVGIAAGSTTSWWLLGGIGLIVGTVVGAVTGDYYFNRPKTQPDTKTSGAEPRPAPRKDGDGAKAILAR
jgi:hypothetical protein